MFASLMIATLLIDIGGAGPAIAGSAIQAAPAPSAEGTWIGDLAGTGWTLRIKNDNGTWSGQYMSARSKVWQPLQSLTVAARRVTFSIKSQPQLDFALEIDRSNKALNGTASIGQTVSLPFSAVRGS